MNTVKKYNTFEELKSNDVKRSELSEVLRRHKAFEKAIKKISSFKLKNKGFIQNQQHKQVTFDSY